MRSFIILFMISTVSLADAQQVIPAHKKVFFYKVNLTDQAGQITNWYLAGFTDSTLLLLPDDYTKAKTSIDQYAIFTQYSYANIKEIFFRRQGTTGRQIKNGILYGGATGLLVGGLAYTIFAKGLAFWGEAGSVGGWAIIAIPTVTGVMSGGLIGSFIGLLLNRHFVINSSREEFESMKKLMLRKMYR